MLFVRVGKNHVNMDLVDGFQWADGMLVLLLNSDNKIFVPDPDKTEYKKLCESIGVRPVEEE